MIRFKVHTASHTVLQALRLFENLLQHKVRIATLLNLSQVDIHSLHLQLLFLAEDTQHVHVLTPTDYGNITIFEIDHLISILDNRTGIRTQEKLILTNTNHQRTLLSGSNNLVRVTLVEHGDGIGANHLVQSHLHSF